MAADVGGDMDPPDLALEDLDGREDRALRAAGAEARRARRQCDGERRLAALARSLRCGVRPGNRGQIEARRHGRLQEGREAIADRLGGVFAGGRHQPLAVDAGLYIGFTKYHCYLLFYVFRTTFLLHQNCIFSGAKCLDLAGDEGVDDIEQEERDSARPEGVRQPDRLQAADHRIVEPALQNQADTTQISIEDLVQPMLADIGQGGGKPLFQFKFFLREGDRRVGQAGIVEGRRLGQAGMGADLGRDVVLRRERPLDMAGPHPQLQHYRGVRGLRQREGMLDYLGDAGQVRTRVQQPDSGLHGDREAALLDHAGALAVVLADHDQRAADDARRGQVRQPVGRHIGADDRLPGHRPAQRIVDRRAQHRRRRGLVGAGFHMDAHLAHQFAGVDQHVQQVRHRRALVTADIGHT